MIFQSVKMAWESVASNKMRSFLTMLGIIIGVIALVVLVSIVNGATTSVSDIISSIGTNLLTVTVTDDKNKPLKLETLDEIASLEYVDLAAPVASDNLYLSHNEESGIAQVTGTNQNYAEIEGTELSAGRWIKAADVNNHTSVAVINEDTASDILGVTNTRNAIGMTMNISGIPYTVIGVIAEDETISISMSSYEAYIPFTSLQRLSGSVSSVTSFVASATSDDDMDAAEDSLETWLLDRFENDDEAYSITNMSTVADAMDSVMNTMSIMLGGIAAISLLVGGIGIMNIMLVSVTERTREIGIRKAIGAGQGSILFQFLVEALMLSLLGDVLGVAFSWVILQIINRINDVTFGLDGTVVLIATIFSLGIGLIFGIYPARKAARKNPIDALHYAG